MLRIILVSLFLGICSTCLIRPWFWIGVKNKRLFNDYGERIGFSNKCWQRDLFVELLFFCFAFSISFGMICNGNGLSFYGLWKAILYCIITQCIWDYQGKTRQIIIWSLALIVLILGIQDSIVSNNINIPLGKITSVPLVTSQTQVYEDADKEEQNIKFIV